MAGFYGFCKNKQTKTQDSAAREQACQHGEQEEEATKHKAEKKDEHMGRFKLFLHSQINTMHKFLWTYNAVCVHATCTVVTMHAICEGLGNSKPNMIQNFSKISRFKIMHHNFKCATVNKQGIF